MKVYLDNDGYVYLHARDDEYCEGDYKIVSDDFLTDHFLGHRKCYRYKDDGIEYDSEREETVKTEEKQNEIRNLREIICFSVINRGLLWYQDLSASRLVELTRWYKAWLDAPETGCIPEKPDWLT